MFVLFRIMPRVAVVTGSNRGLGLDLVRLLCKDFDGDVYLTSRSTEKGHAAVTLLRREGLKPKFHEVDISQPQSIRMFTHFIREEYGGIDVLINNAGVIFDKSSSAPVYRQAELCVSTNVTGTMNMCRMFAPLLNPHSRLIIVVNGYLGQSIFLGQQLKNKIKMCTNAFQLDQMMAEYLKSVKAGTDGNCGWPESPYQVSQICLVAFTKLLAKDLHTDSRKNILINACCPGWLRTGDTPACSTGSQRSGSRHGRVLEEAARDVVWLATMMPGTNSPDGQLVRYRQVIEASE